MKMIISLFIVLILCISLCGCAFVGDLADSTLNIKAKAKTFEFDGLSIELTTDFLQMDFISEDYDFIVGTEDISVMGLKMLHSETEMEDYSVEDFAEVHRSLLESENPTEMVVTDGIPTYHYTGDVEGELKTFALTYYKGSDCFWIVIFATESDDFAEDYAEIWEYAKSVKCQ